MFSRDSSTYYIENSDNNIPDIPDELVTEFHRGNVIIFVGSGVSAWARDNQGHPSPQWHDLLLGLVDHASKRGIINNKERTSELTSLINNSTSVDDLLVAANYIVDKFKVEDLSGIIHKRLSSFSHEHEYKGSINPIQTLASLPCRGFITTNYDKFVEDAYSQQRKNLTVLSANNDRVLNYIESNGRPWLIKLHGRIGFSSRFVLSYNQYEEAYSDGTLKNLLSVLLSKYTMLFVGFGFRDPPIMDVIRSVSRRLGPAKRRHFAISDRKDIGEIKRRFLNENFKIQTLVYDIHTERDSKDNVIEHSDRFDNFVPTIEKLAKAVNNEKLLSSRVLFIISRQVKKNGVPQKKKNGAPLKEFLLLQKDESKSTKKNETRGGYLLFPSIEWTQLVFSDLDELKVRNEDSLKIDICEHLDSIPMKNFHSVNWGPIGAPFWDRSKKHLSSRTPNAKFYFQFCELSMSDGKMKYSKIASDFAKNGKYAVEWMGADEIVEFNKKFPENYNRTAIAEFIDQYIRHT